MGISFITRPLGYVSSSTRRFIQKLGMVYDGL
jgi:hypothetical protein